ncbi:putative dolichyl-phosphate-mannose--glycolipid alpha-mannosyltransferase [Termitomyces sp. T112]|nr:putative dolichyl-phosphate-mannose--glycolipid alpha-mannosyltransferase [Termitomyces sp. T112]
MVFNVASFSALLHALGLTQGSYKPAPTFSVSNSSQFASYHTVNSPPGAQVFFESSKKVSPSPESHDECYVEPYHAPPIEEQDFLPFDNEKATMYRYRKQQSVNLGSWFVHEDWMTPSLFRCAGGKKLSELDIASGWGSQRSARSVLERHWDTFITRSDFERLASIGINTVRLPIGYWSLGPPFTEGTPFAKVSEVYKNSWPRIMGAINNAAKYGIGVLVDLHAAVGSQNGQPHSGISDGASNMFDNPQYMDKTIDVLSFLMQQLSPVSNVVGIQLLNEPEDRPELPDFYTRAIESMRNATSNSTLSLPLYIHDGFNLERYSQFVANRTDFVVQDHHSYFVFTPSDSSEPASQHTSDIKGPISKSFVDASLKERGNLFIGEWSCALSSDSMAHEADPDQARRDFCSGQMSVYANAAAGWSFWSYLKEDCENDLGWCFKSAVGKSLPGSFFAYDNTPTEPQRVKEVSSRIASMNPPSSSEILQGGQGNTTTPDGASSAKKTPIRRFEFFWKEKRRSRDRFDAIHRRHQFDDASLTPAERSTVKGYTNGFLACKRFASHSPPGKVGFVDQYMADNWPPDVEHGTEQNYHDAFGNGLKDCQGHVQTLLNEAH